MTATFGKLSHETLEFHDGLNILSAPNEWGKSTWCAFLLAMLYGIDTSAKKTKNSLPDKVRYAPWSGEPMSGRMDIRWNGRDITIERASTARIPMGEFRAFETASGAAVPELTGDNCGLMLLGVEKSVFTRSGFLKLTDLPVTQDEALRRRLNALVTTGDESGDSDTLAKKLKDLKNACKSNARNGAIPKALGEREELANTLQKLQDLKARSGQIREQQSAVEKQIVLLNNHLDALEYDAARDYAQRYAQAKNRRDELARQVESLEADCAALPPESRVTARIRELDSLKEQREFLRQEAQLRPAPPQAPESPSVFRGLDPRLAAEQAKTDYADYRAWEKAAGSKLRLVVCAVLAAVGILLLALRDLPFLIGGGILLAAAVFCLISHFGKVGKARTRLAVLTEKYRPIPPQQWEAAADASRNAQQLYADALASYDEARRDLEARIQAVEDQILRHTGGQSVKSTEDSLEAIRQKHLRLDALRKELAQAQSLADTLGASRPDAQPPRLPDTLTLNKEQTLQSLENAQHHQARLHSELGNCQGQILLLGEEEILAKRLSELDGRIFRLQEMYGVLEIALETVEQAKSQLQRRFAPRISRSAQEIFSALTGGRYDRLKLEEDLQLSVSAQGEDTLRAGVLRSDGTVDQLYLALRLAVARELTPDAPMILDDALARFDDDRMKKALEVLGEQDKQIILFTCHSREKA